MNFLQQYKPSLKRVTRVSHVKTFAKTGLISVIAGCSILANAFCFEEAAARHGVNAFMLGVIASHESRLKETTVVANSDGSVDMGLMGINSVHLNDLRAFGIGREQLLTGCVNVNVGAWLLSKKIKKYGNTWRAYGAYHSENEPYSSIYQRKIYEAAVLLQKQGFVQKVSEEGQN